MQLDPEDYAALGWAAPDPYDLAVQISNLAARHNEARRVVHDKRTSQPPTRVAAARAKATATRRELFARRRARRLARAAQKSP